MKRLFTLLTLLLTFAITTAQSRAERILEQICDPKSDYVAVIAHRSDWRHHPENSLAAMEGAIKMGVDILEIDVQRTADGVLVCCHDRTVNRTTTGEGKVSELTAEYISTLKLKGKSGEATDHSMPTLAQALDLCRDRVLINIDKGYNYYDQIMELLIERNMVRQVVIKGSKKPATVAKTFAKHSTNMLYMPIINYNAKSWERHSPLFESYLNCNLDILAYEICWNGTLKGERKIFKRVTDTSSRLWVNTMWDKLCGGDKHGFEDDRALNGNEHKVYGKLIKYGVRMIQTDRPELLINYLESRGHHTLP